MTLPSPRQFAAAVSTSALLLGAAGWPLHAAAAADTAAAAEPRFDLLEFEISGNTALPVPAVEAAVMPFLGPDRSMAQVESARAALERAYQSAGFLTVLVDVPEQRVEDGVVRLQVIEGRVRSLRVTGSRYFSQGHIRNVAAELAPGQVPNFNTVQTQLAGLNRTEDRRVQPVLKPGPTPGTVDVELQVADRLPASASVEMNNRHSAATTPWRLHASLAYNNLWQLGHGIGLTAITAPADTEQAKLLVANYTLPLANDASFTTYLVASDSLVEPLSAVTVAGKGLSVGARWMLPLAPIGNYSHSLQLGLDYKDFETRTVTGELGILTPLRYMPLQAGYSGASFDRDRQTTLNTQLTFAHRSVFERSVDCADTGLADQFACSSKDARGTFAHWRADLRHTRTVWAGTSLSERLGWQLASQPLVSNERYSLGGVETVRGYTDAVSSGDRAWLAGIEWRAPNLGGKDGWRAFNGFDLVQAYAFIEGGRTKVLNALAEQPAVARLLGTGVGLQWRLGASANGQFDLAVPLKDLADERAGSARLHVRVQLAL